MDPKNVEARVDEKAQSNPVTPADGPLDDDQLDAVAGGRANLAKANLDKKYEQTVTRVNDLV